MQHRANRNVRGRHRRTTPLHSHRAPGTPVGERGRQVVAVALVAGVGVAGVTTATSGAASGPAAGKNRPAAAQAELAPSAAPPASAAPALSPSAAAPSPSLAPSLSGSATRAGVGSVGTGSAGAELSFAPQARKVKPLPLWVHPLPEAATTSCFGPRWGRLHAGVDLAAPDGTRIRAAGAGTVMAAGPAEGYGNAVLIDHGNGYLTHYGHMSTITVTPGQHVTVGEQLGNEGSTGHSTGPHLHFEVHQDSYQNPIEPTAWMHEHGVDITGCEATAAQ